MPCDAAMNCAVSPLIPPDGLFRTRLQEQSVLWMLMSDVGLKPPYTDTAYHNEELTHYDSLLASCRMSALLCFF